jgi:hypothetical protein
MKLWFNALIGSAALLSFHAFSDVKVNLHRDITPLVVEGEEVGIRLGTKKQLTIPNGTNQIVVRVSKLITNHGVYEKFRSKPVVVTFDAADTELTLNPAKVFTRAEQLGDFQENPEIVMYGSSGNAYLIRQGVLKRGSGISRDYERELEKYNKNNGISNKITSLPVTTIDEDNSLKVVSTLNKINATSSSVLSELKSNFEGLTLEQRKEFLMWAISQ